MNDEILTLANVRQRPSMRHEDIELLVGLETLEVQALMTPLEREIFEAVGSTLAYGIKKTLTPNWRAWAAEILARAKGAAS